MEKEEMILKLIGVEFTLFTLDSKSNVTYEEIAISLNGIRDVLNAISRQ